MKISLKFIRCLIYRQDYLLLHTCLLSKITEGCSFDSLTLPNCLLKQHLPRQQYLSFHQRHLIIIIPRIIHYTLAKQAYFSAFARYINPAEHSLAIKLDKHVINKQRYCSWRAANMLSEKGRKQLSIPSIIDRSAFT